MANSEGVEHLLLSGGEFGGEHFVCYWGFYKALCQRIICLLNDLR